ncbi:PepSY domain-containing protein [Methanosarcina sp. MSH10X1]|uniref:PepSY domain-containing protein n=1 Tax=Methanosarcina sp. MSH10X1 TaxID=2507075 RepID=UPI001F0C1766|nr:PepSY domain-containing protein [Methanosarcina sp. MSH10X1]
MSLLAISVTGCTSTENGTSDTAGEAVSPERSAPSPADETSTGMDAITMEEAKEIALAHAGLTEADVTFVKAELDTDNGRQEYEIEFYSGNTEYDYEIDASTGDILSYDSDVENYSTSGSIKSGESKTYIGEEKARSIALAKVPRAKESDIRLHLDSEDGVTEYEGSVVYDNVEYEFEIDAATGKIVNWSSEPLLND